jgi:hypothetical protein
VDLIHQAPYATAGLISAISSWEVDDPLVHYTRRDLEPALRYTPAGLSGNAVPPLTSSSSSAALGTNNQQTYKPWGGKNGTTPEIVRRYTVQDPLDLNPLANSWAYRVHQFQERSDLWEFPTNKFPNIGWLGRVHRGTPWQTIYLKSEVASAAEWLKPNGPGNSIDTHPTNDWRLVDVFTVAQHPNATRGRLSINQTNLAAWSAVFSGISVTKLDGDSQAYSLYPEVIQPASLDTNQVAAVAKIVDGINRVRDLRGGPRQFTRLSDILAVPELSTSSPFLVPPIVSTSANSDKHSEYSVLRDSDYERIPQQILSLLKVGEPRFVVYAYGQSLKPAPNSIVTSGPQFGLCQNYQITGEVAYRAVVRVEPERDEAGAPIWDPNHRDRFGNMDFHPPRAVIESFNVLPPE